MKLEANVGAKWLALEEGAHEDELKLILRGEEEEWQKFCETKTAASLPVGLVICEEWVSQFGL